MCHFPSHECQPRTQNWPPDAQPTAGGTALLRIIMEAETQLGCCSQTADFFLAPKNLQVGTGF